MNDNFLTFLEFGYILHHALNLSPIKSGYAIKRVIRVSAFYAYAICVRVSLSKTTTVHYRKSGI